MKESITQTIAITQCELPTSGAGALSNITNKLEQESIRQLPDSHYISVKQAAHRLNMSPSLIYGMDRSKSSFPILKCGWRVWIESGGLEAFIASTQSGQIRKDSELQELPHTNEVENSSDTKDEQVGSVGSSFLASIKAVPVATQIWIGPPSTQQGVGSGQRHLPFAWVY